jgi:hypothetical protein
VLLFRQYVDSSTGDKGISARFALSGERSLAQVIRQRFTSLQKLRSYQTLYDIHLQQLQFILTAEQRWVRTQVHRISIKGYQYYSLHIYWTRQSTTKNKVLLTNNNVYLVIKFGSVRGRNSSVSTVTRLPAGQLGFDSRQGHGIFLILTASRLALGPTEPPAQWETGALSPGVEMPGREADHSPASSAEVKNAWSYTSTLPYVLMAWCLVKCRVNFSLPLIVLFRYK